MTNNHSKRLPLMIAGFIFALIAVLHVLRIIYQVEIVISGHNIPMNVSYLGAFLGFLLAIWMFKASSKSRS